MIGLRPYLDGDRQRCLEIFSSSIEELTADDYDEAQREAWIASAEDEQAFANRLAGSLTLVATREGERAGFACLKGADLVDMLYVAPEHARQGVGAALLTALAKLAAARGAKQISADVSDTAKPLFERHGFIAERRNLITLGDQWLANTTMAKTLVAADAATRH